MEPPPAACFVNGRDEYAELEPEIIGALEKHTIATARDELRRQNNQTYRAVAGDVGGETG